MTGVPVVGDRRVIWDPHVVVRRRRRLWPDDGVGDPGIVPRAVMTGVAGRGDCRRYRETGNNKCNSYFHDTTFAPNSAFQHLLNNQFNTATVGNRDMKQWTKI